MSRSSRPASTPSLQELRASRGATPPFHRRHRRWLIAGGAAAGLILFGFFGLPPIVKAQAIKQLSARLGREVTIEKIRINPLVLSVTIEGFGIAQGPAGEGEFTGWERLHVNLDSWPLFLGRVRFSEIELDGFRARVARNEAGGFNFDDIVARVTAKGGDEDTSGAAPDTVASKPTPLAIGRLVVTEARVSFKDDSLARPYAAELGPLTFTLQNFQTVGDPDSPYEFEAITGAGEQVAWRGTVSADPVKSQGELRLANIDIARLSPYYHTLVTGELRSAFVDLSGHYAFELTSEGPALALSNGELTLRDVRFGAAGMTHDAFALKRLAVVGVSADAAALTASIGKVEVEGVDLKIVRDAEGVDLLRLLAPPSGGATVAAPSSSGSTGGTETPVALPRVTLGELSIAGVRVEATDISTPRRAEHRVENVVFTLRDVDTSDLAKPLPLTLEVTLPSSGRVALAGTVAAQPVAAELELVLERVGFANASPYVEPFLNIRLADGLVRANGKATLRDGAAAFAGDFGVSGFRAVDGKLAEDFLRWTDFSVSGILATTEPLTLHVDEIRFVEPVAAVRVESDGSLNISQATEPSVPASAGAETAASADVSTSNKAMPPVTVGRFAFERAAFRFEDRSITPTARGGISDFTGAITGLTSEALGRADVELSGKVDGVAPVAITGKLNPLGSPAFVDLTVDFKGIDLQPGAGPYVGKFVGRELTRGSLNVAIKAKLDDRKIDTNNVVTLDQFFLGARTNSPDATSLPVGLALALLRDTDGRIVVDLPVRGSLDDPNFKIGRVVMRVVVNILTKAATSPFSLLGAAFGGGGDELGWQDFAAGETISDASGLKKLETVAKALNARPALNLDIVGSYDPVRDGAALRLARLEQVVRAKIWEDRRLADPNTPPPEQLEITPEQRVVILTRLYAAAFPPAEGEAAPVVVAGGDAGGIVVPIAANTAAPSSSEKTSRRQVGRLPRYGAVAAAPTVAEAPATIVAPATEGSEAPSASATETGEPAVPTLTVEQMVLRLAAGMDIPETDLQALGEARAQGIRAWLLETGKVPADRIFLGPLKPGGTRANLNLR